MGVNNEDIACYLVIKHSWRGKYKRVFSIGTKAVTTYNPNSNMESTNQWVYHDFINILPDLKSQGTNEFTIAMIKGKKEDSMRFSSEHYADIITQALEHRMSFHTEIIDNLRANAHKVHWSEQRIPVVLEVTPSSLDQLDPLTGVCIAHYYYKDIEALVPVSDISGGIAVQSGGFGRLHIFLTDRRDEICKKIEDNAKKYIGISVQARKTSISLHNALENKWGKYNNDEDITSLYEVVVHKRSKRHNDPVKRLLCISETCLIERDPSSYSIVTLKPLADVFALIRHQENSQMLSVEYIRAPSSVYTSSDRDSLLASLLDGVRASGNLSVHVRMRPTPRGKRLGPLEVPVEEEVETIHLSFLQRIPNGWTFSEAVDRFNANVAYSGLIHSVTADGLFAKNKEKLIMGSLGMLIVHESDDSSTSPVEVEAYFHAVRRLVASKAGFSALTSLPGFRERIGLRVLTSINRNDPGVAHAALDMVCALMQPMHESPDLKQEQINKKSLLSSAKFMEKLIQSWVHHVKQETGSLVIVAMLDFLTFALCPPYCETTDGAHFDLLLRLVAANGRALYRLFQHPSLAIVKGAGLVLKAVIEEGEDDIPEKMQKMALSEGALPKHLFTALFTQTTDGRLLTHRQLSQHLIALWTADNKMALELLARIVPQGLLVSLESKEVAPLEDINRLITRDNLKFAEEEELRNRKSQVIETLDKAYKTSVRKVERLVERHMDKLETVEKHLQTGAKHIEKYYEQYLEKHVDYALQHWKTKMKKREKSEEEKLRERPLLLRKRREQIKSSANWPMLYYMFHRDHTLPNLLWNYKTREELRVALEAEIRAFNEDSDVRSSNIIAWNHAEFEVHYHSLKDEIKVGDYYLRILLEQEKNGAPQDSPIRKSYEFFNDLYHRFLLTSSSALRCICLQALTLVYGLHNKDIGPFNDTRYIVTMLSRTSDKSERDRLLLFMNKLILEKQNVKELIESDGVRILTQLLTLAHLHVNRAVMPTQSNVIEASPDMVQSSEKEWYYQDTGKERAGPYSYSELKELWTQEVITSRTLCWAQGMEAWYPLSSIPQLKWSFCATGEAVLNESDLATLILNMLIAMCQFYPSRTEDDAVIRPLPKIKKILSEPTVLPHIIQLLLTFHPILVEKVAALLTEVLRDNPRLLTVYLTGVFFFILMYTGSNVLPIGKFFYLSHLQQTFRADEAVGGDIITQSILSQLLPEAMVCYLENYGPEKFAEIFLGEFDTPEVIWSSEMRRYMIEKIASHLADFTPRLMSNTRVRYHYCAIPHIIYPQLQYELFCDIYYLRHLCDTVHFPDWPIKDPVALLKKVLVAWRTEVEKQPSSMTVEEAYIELELQTGVRHDDATIRKAYFKLAQKFHPDKNPDGRDRFEKVNMSYEYLCSKLAHSVDGPDPKNILLIIRTQSILFSRYKEVLAPYKYAGYPMLIKTIQLEADDEQLFSKETSLLAAAAELTYHTINCSALNAEELRRERGLEALQGAYNRCVNVLNNSSQYEDVAVQVCINIGKCYTAAALFPMCREKLLEMSYFIKDLCHTLYVKHLTRLCLVGVQCVGALALDHILQMNLLQAGILWHLLLNLFFFDYTLDEGGVSKSEETNQQELINQVAKASLTSCGLLAGLYEDERKTPANSVILSALQAMLTPYIVELIPLYSPGEVLKILTSNLQTPYLMWDNSTRVQLTDFLSINQTAHVTKGLSDPSYGAEFQFDAHKDELVIGGVFVRIYNEQPTFNIKKPKELTIDLLNFISGETQYVHSLISLNSVSLNAQPRLKSITEALQALVNVIKNNPGVEMQCIGHFKLLFSLLALERCSSVQFCVLSLIEGVTSNAECVSDIASSEVLAYLLLTLYSPCLAEKRSTTLSILHALMSNTKIVKEALSKGGAIYLLNLFCCDLNDIAIREKTAELLGKMTSDKLVGPKVRIILFRLLPLPIIDQMRESPSTTVHMYQMQQENPELIWNDESREKVVKVVEDLTELLYSLQKNDPNAVWKFPDNITLTSTSGEIVVGGVYLRLLAANPSWALRRPKQFMTDLFDELLELLGKGVYDGERLELIESVIVSLCSSQRNLLEYLPSLGHIPRVVKYLSSKIRPTVKAATLSTHQFSFSKSCADILESTDVVAGLVSAMKLRGDLVGVASEALHNLFSGSGAMSSALVEQGLRANVIPFLLSLLESNKLQVSNPASTKAQIVTCLKTMASSPLHSDEVITLLEKSPVWAQYRDQKHDLFLDTPPVAGFLTAGTPGISGFLTQGSAQIIPTGPPPTHVSPTTRGPLF